MGNQIAVPVNNMLTYSRWARETEQLGAEDVAALCTTEPISDEQKTVTLEMLSNPSYENVQNRLFRVYQIKMMQDAEYAAAETERFAALDRDLWNLSALDLAMRCDYVTRHTLHLFKGRAEDLARHWALTRQSVMSMEQLPVSVNSTAFANTVATAIAGRAPSAELLEVLNKMFWNGQN